MEISILGTTLYCGRKLDYEAVLADYSLALCMFVGLYRYCFRTAPDKFFLLWTRLWILLYGNKSLLADGETLISDLEEKGFRDG